MNMFQKTIFKQRYKNTKNNLCKNLKFLQSWMISYLFLPPSQLILRF